MDADEEWYNAYRARLKRKQDSLARQEAEEAADRLAAREAAASARRPAHPVTVHSKGSQMHGLREVGDGSWRLKAECRGFDVNFFFPGRGEIQDTLQFQHEFCDACPVHIECLLYALRVEGGSSGYARKATTGSRNMGVVAGTSIRERALIKRALRPRSPEHLTVEELATFMETWVQSPRRKPGRPKSSGGPEVTKHEDDDHNDDDEPSAVPDDLS
jgi:hypothetical protein